MMLKTNGIIFGVHLPEAEQNRAELRDLTELREAAAEKTS